MKDRNGVEIKIGDGVMLTPGMAVAGIRKAKINRIDGEYIYVTVMIDGKPYEIERYWSEMEKQ